MKKLLNSIFAFLILLVACSKEEQAPAPPPTPTFTLNFSADTGGTVSTEGGTYNQGSKITVTATPDGQFLFKEWSDGSTQNPREITVTSNLTLKASFIKKTFPLSVTIDGEGTVQEQVIIQGSTTETEYNAGTTVRLTATPNEGWEFSLWVVDGVVITENPIEVSIEKGREATVFFKRTQFELNITIEGEGTVKEEVIVQPGQYDYETVVRLTAVPAEGYVFSGWSGDVTSEENPIEVEIKSEINITVTFSEEETYTIKYPTSDLENYSKTNQNTSWYRTNKSFDRLYDTHNSKFFGFEVIGDSLTPFVRGTWSSDKNYYWAALGVYLFTDLNGDGYRDLWLYYFKDTWPTNGNGLHLFNEIEKNKPNSDIQSGLTHVRKQVLSDFNNDGISEVMLFSHGYDRNPFPGDSIAYFNGLTKKYTYLSDDIGYFHGGATGDVNNDGYEDIVAYSGGSGAHPVCYLNNAYQDFNISNHIFKNFSSSDKYDTVELFDINQDGWLDLFLGGRTGLIYIKNINGTFDINDGQYIYQTNYSDETIPVDISFFDFNGDGLEEILVMKQINSYDGFELKLFDIKNDLSEDITTEYFEDTTRTGNNAWIKWIRIFDFDYDGDLDVVADGLFGTLNGPQGRVMYWNNENGKFGLVIK
jgi:hypothetical protein